MPEQHAELKARAGLKMPGMAGFFLGIFVAAGAGAKLPPTAGKVPETFPDTWPFFLAGSVIAVVGLIVWRIALKASVALELQQQDGEHVQQNPFALLDASIPEIRRLLKDIDGMDNATICLRTQEILDRYVLPFADVRRRVIDRLGMADGAEILVTVAYGERMLNRVWSAASDEYKPEAVLVLPDALSALEEAQQQAQTALAKLST